MAGKLVIRNIGLILSGRIEEPIFDGDCLVAIDGRILAGSQTEAVGLLLQKRATGTWWK